MPEAIHCSGNLPPSLCAAPRNQRHLTNIGASQGGRHRAQGWRCGTLRRWTKDGQLHADQRPLAPRPEPANKLSAAERAAVLSLCNSKEFSSLPPGQIVPKLADQGRHLASESSFYRMSHARMVSSITVAGPSRRFGANHPPAIRPVRPARSGLGTSPGCPGRWPACSSTSI